MTSRYYTMTDSTGESGFLPTVTFTSDTNVFTSAQRIAQLASIPGTPVGSITGFYEADFSGNITSIDAGAFENDSKVVVVTINNVATINANAFKNCTALRSITLDCAVNASTKKYLLNSIGAYAFYGCSSLRNLHIPDTVRVIPDYMCYGCTSLEVAVMGYGWARSVNTYDTSFNSVNNTIGTEAFNNCYALSYFVVPETVAAIGSLAFANTISLSLVTILGRPTIASNAFTTAMGAGATYYYDNSASYVTLTAITAQTLFPAGSNKRAYREIDLSGAAELTSAHVNARVPINTWWKGKILHAVNTLASYCFRASELTPSRYQYMIGVSFPSTLTSIGYGAFESYNASGALGVNNVAGYYIPNAVSLVASGGNSFTFSSGDATNRNLCSTKQFVFISGTNTLSTGQYAFNYNSARAFIISNITIVPFYCFYNCKNAQFFSFFQKNAYTLLTVIGNDTQYVLEGCFSTGISGYRHYIHIPKQITHIGADAFRNILDKLVVTVYHNTINSAGTTELTGLVTAGYLAYSSSTTGTRFHGPIAPTIHIINNNFASNGAIINATSAIGAGFPYHLLYSPNVTTIPKKFSGLVDLKSIAIHHSAKQTVVIEAEAFINCTGLIFVYFNNRLKTMNLNAFRNARLSNSFDLIDAHPLESIYHAAFYTDIGTYISNIRQITIPKTVIALGSYVFGCNTLGQKSLFTTLSFETGIQFWGDATVSVLETSTSSGNYMAIPPYFCERCDFLMNISFLNTVDAGGNAITADLSGALARPDNNVPITTRYNSQILSPFTIKRIGQNAFNSNSRLQSIRVPDGVTTIDFQAFYDTYSVTYLYLPDTLTTMGLAAFNYVGAVNKFGYSGLEVSVRIPQAMIDFVVPDTGVNGTGYFNTNATATRYFTVSFNTSSSKVTNGVIGRFTTAALNTYIKYHVIIQSGISGILGGSVDSQRAFDNFTSLKTLTIADTVTNIGVGALYNCTGLTNVFISPTSNLTLLENSAVQQCTALTSFFIPNSIQRINSNVFYGCTSLATVTYGDNPGLKYIGDYAFFNATRALTSIFIPSSVVFIGLNAFIGNAGTNILNTVTFGGGSRLKSIGGLAFGSSTATNAATYLKDLVLPSTVRYMGGNTTTNAMTFRNAFKFNHSGNLILPSSLTFIPYASLFVDDAASATDISNIYVPMSITATAGPRIHNGYRDNTKSKGGVGGYVINNSKSGSLIYLPSQLSEIISTGGDADATFPTNFPNYTNNNRTRSYYRTDSYNGNIGTSLTYLQLVTPVAFTNNPTNTSQMHVNINEGVTVIGGGTLNITNSTGSGTLNLISVNIPSTVTKISANAFNGCNALVYVTFSENSKLTTIDASAFSGCSLIHDIQLPDTLTTIGANAFNGCYNLASISIPYNVTSIGTGAFNVNSSSSTTDIVRQGGYLAYKLGSDIYGEAISDYSGYSVSLSQDGKIVAIGSVYNDASGGDSGQVRVYKYQTITDATWTNYTVGSFSHTGTAPFNKPIVVNGGDSLPVSGKYYWVQLGVDINGETNYNFAGWSVSLSSDGTTVAIGALVNYGAGNEAGQTRVYKYQTIADANWTNYTVNSFAHTGTAPFNKSIVVNGGDTNPVSGKFYWVQLGSDINGETANSQSGCSVSLSSNGTIVAIGARYDDLNGATDSGSARIYQYNGSIWNKLGLTISVNGGTALDNFGNSVSISDDGTIVAIAAQYFDSPGFNDAGIVRVYKYSSNSWSLLGSNIMGEAVGDYAGESVSLNSNGTIVAIGAHNNDGGGSNSGHVRVYQYNSATTNWLQLGQDINGAAANDHFGNSVSLSSDGTILAVGSRYSDTTGSIIDTGMVRIYKYFNGTWQKLGGDIRGDFTSDNAGFSVSLSKDGTTVAIGANGNDGNGNDSGMVRVYQISNFTVRLHQRLYNTISSSFSTYFPGISPVSVQVIPELQLTNTLNPSKLTISQINNIYIRYRQSQLGSCTFITVSDTGDGNVGDTHINAALSGSTGLVHLDFGPNVTFITPMAGVNNKRIYSVAIPKKVTAVGDSAFNGCTNLTYLSFHPDSVCTNLTYLSFHNTSIIDLALPDSLTAIGASAFQSSPNLASVCIPKNVTAFGTNAFHNCSKLTSVALPVSLPLATYGTSSYFNINGSSTTGITFSSYSLYSVNSAIPHFKLSEYSLPSGIIQNVVDSAVTYIDHLAYAYYPDITLYAVTTNKQTQTPGEYSYTTNNVQIPIMPAAFALNGGSFVSNSMFPLYRSIPDLNVFSLDGTPTNWQENTDDYYVLMPGYSICIYNNLYDEENLFTDGPSYRYFDNEFGNVPLNIAVPAGVVNTTSSILILFKGRILSKYFAS